ncbi:MAG: hypothetical protein CME19_25510 [Gemmatimonadetes bacterium]|nr:hypothetical protein [Gemmatimonadota bacterium]
MKSTHTRSLVQGWLRSDLGSPHRKPVTIGNHMSTRFLFIADTHWGSGEKGYTLQPKYDHHLHNILDALDGGVDEHGTVDFILHGGDMVHTLDLAGLEAVSSLFNRRVPVWLCLGNHDLTRPNGLKLWMEHCSRFFRDDSPNYAIETPDCVIHVIPNQYGPEPYCWEEEQTAHFLPDQVAELETRLSSGDDRCQIILTHSPIHAIDVGQTGREEPFHKPPADFTKTVTNIAQRYNISAVLGAHSHANMHKELNGTHYITVSSFVETPFEFKLFEVDSDTIRMTTHNLNDRVDFKAEYNWNQTFAQGRARDRTFERPL